MRLQTAEDEEPQFQMAPMIDMVFLLLVFFMLASNLSQQQQLPLDIPEATRGVVPRERPDRYVINISREGDLYSGMNPVDLDELQTLVEAALLENPQLRVYVRADAATPHREIRRVMGRMAAAGIDDFLFGVFAVE